MLSRQKITVQDMCLDGQIKGKNDLRERIACALATRVRSVFVDDCGYSPSKSTLHCTGNASEERFFAKVFLTGSCPIPRRFQSPWDKGADTEVPLRPIRDQISAEWDMTLKMRGISRGEGVPRPLGKSYESRTVVWEEAKGTRLDRVVTRARLANATAESGARGMFLAGRWLRMIHDASIHGEQNLDVGSAISALERLRSGKREKESRYLATASRVLKASVAQSGVSSFSVPIAFTHGDFSLPNLLWGKDAGQLSVVDFELCDDRPLCFDLFSLVSDLRAHLLNPFIPKSVIANWERSFWNGYGPMPAETVLFVNAFALARVFYHHLPKLLTRKDRRGWVAGANALVYRMLFERFVITHRLPLTAN